MWAFSRCVNSSGLRLARCVDSSRIEPDEEVGFEPSDFVAGAAVEHYGWVWKESLWVGMWRLRFVAITVSKVCFYKNREAMERGEYPTEMMSLSRLKRLIDDRSKNTFEFRLCFEKHPTVRRQRFVLKQRLQSRTIRIALPSMTTYDKWLEIFAIRCPKFVRCGPFDGKIVEQNKVVESEEERSEVCRCSICLESLTDAKEIITLRKCSHAYCVDCLTRWAKNKRLCPVCKGTF